MRLKSRERDAIAKITAEITASVTLNVEAKLDARLTRLEERIHALEGTSNLGPRLGGVAIDLEARVAALERARS